MNNVFVAGSINMDVVATATRYPKIGETVFGKQVFFFPGGKGANQAVSSAKIGAPTILIGKVGSDAFGRELRSFLSSQHIDLQFVGETAESHTGTAVITIADSNNAIVVVPGANALVSDADVRAPALSRGDVLISQFEIPIGTVSAFFRRARPAGAKTILNPAPAVKFDRDLLGLVDVLILNETELGVLTGHEIHENDPDGRILDAARSLQSSNEQTICVTLGKRGALALIGTSTVTIPGQKVDAVDSTGAGDCFVGAVGAQIAAGSSLEDAFRYANIAASICVQRMGAGPSMPTKTEVDKKLEVVST
jgi:ribokinase